MFEGHYGTGAQSNTCNNATNGTCPNGSNVIAQFEHVTQNTSWSWSFSCGVPTSCTISTQPSTSSSMTAYGGESAPYDY
jgi:hypothetical protein